jgi:hypothetical protein
VSKFLNPHLAHEHIIDRFQYSTPRIRLTPNDLRGTPLANPKMLHFICSPTRASVIMSEVEAEGWKPITIYEPIPVRVHYVRTQDETVTRHCQGSLHSRGTTCAQERPSSNFNTEASAHEHLRTTSEVIISYDVAQTQRKLFRYCRDHYQYRRMGSKKLPRSFLILA